tara:strand:- start:95 stop:703 length:609 start_codon:yes stop_codon:yes gene_type:complete
MKYKIVTEDLVKNLIEFLDEIQFDAAAEKDAESMQKVNFCNWAIQELLNSYDGILKNKKDSKYPKNPNKKSRDQYVDETFMDWNLPEMTDEEYEKLVDQFDAFLRGWEKEYLKNNKKKKPKKTDGEDWKPRIEDVAQHCSLEEIRDMLLDDPELTDHERFELYYEEHERVNRKKEKTYTLDEMLKGTKLKRYKSPPKKSNNK